LFELYLREYDEYVLKFGSSYNIKNRIKNINSDYCCCEKIKIMGIIEPNSNSISENEFLKKRRTKELQYDRKKSK